MDKIKIIIKIVVIILVVCCILFLSCKFLLGRYLSKNTIFDVKSINSQVFILVEKYLDMELPKNTSIVNVSLESWRDDIIYLQLKIPTDEIEQINTQIGNNNIEVVELSNNRIKWWNLKEDRISKVIGKNNPPSTYYFMNTDNNSTDIFIEVWVRSRLSEKERNLFEN